MKIYCVNHAEHLDASRHTDPKGANFEVSDAYSPIVGTKVSNITRTGHSTHVTEGQKVYILCK